MKSDKSFENVVDFNISTTLIKNIESADEVLYIGYKNLIFLGYLKSEVYINRPNNLDDLKNRIQSRYCFTIPLSITLCVSELTYLSLVK